MTTLPGTAGKTVIVAHLIPIASFLSILGFGLLGMLAFQAIQSSNESEDSVFRTQATLAQIARFHNHALDAESRGRAFLISGSEHFRRDYEVKLAAMDAEFREPKRTSSDNPAHADSVSRLEPLIAGRYAWLTETDKPQGGEKLRPPGFLTRHGFSVHGKDCADPGGDAAGGKPHPRESH